MGLDNDFDDESLNLISALNSNYNRQSEERKYILRANELKIKAKLQKVVNVDDQMVIGFSFVSD